jgi:hypothetical protein
VALKNAIRVATEFAAAKLNRKIEEQLASAAASLVNHSSAREARPSTLS